MFNIDKYKLPNLKVFWLTFIPMFIMVTMQLAGVQSPTFINPLSASKPEVNIQEIITEKITAKTNSYTINKPLNLSIISPSFANSIQADNASAYGVIDFDSGNVVAEKNLSERLSIASLTKIMTAVVALDLSSENEVFTITPTASQIIPTKIGVEPGQKMTVNELLNATLLTSANDAAEVIKEGIDAKYGKGTFINSMNEKAQFLQLKNTRFSNAQGFDNKNNYSTAEDLAVLSHYALSNYPLIAEISKKDFEYLQENNNHPEFDLINWNGLIGVYPNVLGFKIGNTGRAGKTTVVISERNNKKILVVLLGAPGVLERDLWAAELLDMGFSKTLGLKPIGISEEQLMEKYQTWNY